MTLRLLAGAAAILSLSAVAAKADIFVGACIGAGCDSTSLSFVQITQGPNALPLPYAAVIANTWTVSGSAQVTSPPPTFGSNTIDVAQTGGTFPSTLRVFVSGTDVNQAGLSAILSAAQMLALPAGWSAQEQTYWNQNNLAFATQNALLDTGVQGPFGTSIPPALGLSFTSLDPAFPIPPFSITEVYTINGTGPSTLPFQGQITMSAVPGPVVGAGLPGLLAACGALVGFARRRRKQRA
jgi:hypothetical protein